LGAEGARKWGQKWGHQKWGQEEIRCISISLHCF
jgi:hypothetical protein